MSKINIVQIQTALLVPLTAQFIVNKLQVQPAETQKRLVLWNASDYPLICDRLNAWISKAKGVDITKISGERPKKDAAPADDPFGDGGGTPPDDPFGDGEAKGEDAASEFF